MDERDFVFLSQRTKYQKNQTFSFWKFKVLRIDLTDCHQFAPDVKEECHNYVIMFLKAYPKKCIHATEEEMRKNSSICLPHSRLKL